MIAADMFSEFKKSGIFSSELGKRYRNIVLARSGSADTLDNLRDFLGRESNSEAFLKKLSSSQ